MEMISILCKRRLVFTHPDMRTSAAVKLAIEKQEAGKPLEGYHTATAEPFQAQEAPAWVKSDPLWALYEKKGDLVEVPRPAVKVAVPAAGQAKQPVVVVQPLKPAAPVQAVKPVPQQVAKPASSAAPPANKPVPAAVKPATGAFAPSTVK